MSANFTPNQNTYENLTPFKSWLLLQINTWGQVNFPFVESDFDELTNYGMMQKFMGCLNDVISNENKVEEDMTNLFNAFTELQSYVNNYFDNLDVQDEINSKLDSMVQDGTLTNLIGAYIQPRIDVQNQRITQVENMVESVASGSPLVASSTSEMTDTTKTYVNTTDGKWYYYDGDSWEIGGTYQSTGIADGSVTYNNLESELQNSFVEETTIVNSTFYNGKYIQPNGSEASVNTTCYNLISVNPLDSYVVSVPYNTSVMGSTQPVYMFKNDDSVVSYKKASDLTITDNIFTGIIDIPTGVNTLIINQTQTGLTNINNTLKIVKVNRYIQNNISKNQLDSKLQTIFTDVYTTITPTLFVNNAIVGPNSVDAINGYKVYIVNVSPKEKYKITSKQIYSNPIVAFGNKNASKTYTINGDDYVFKCSYDKIVGTSGQQFTDYVFEIPDNCDVIYLNQQNSETLSISKMTSYKIKVTDLDVSDLNPLNNKTILFVGDSICAATTTGVKGWATLISENNPTATIYNYGQDGATIADDGEDNNNVITKIRTMYSEHPTADYIIIQGGVNDLWKSIPLGTFEERGNFNESTTYDTTTFSGALENVFYYAMTHFSGKKIAYIVTQKIYNAGNFYKYMNRAKEICKKWSIPYIDLFEESDMNYLISEQRQDYSITNVVATGDGCHPNLAGYQIITPKIENWLKYKI